MSEVWAEITLLNIRDKNIADEGYMPQNQVQRLTVNALLDTGAWTLLINEATHQKLGLKVQQTSESTLATGIKVPSRISEYEELRWKDRKTACEAVFISADEAVLLGAYPLEGMGNGSSQKAGACRRSWA